MMRKNYFTYFVLGFSVLIILDSSHTWEKGTYRLKNKIRLYASSSHESDTIIWLKKGQLVELLEVKTTDSRIRGRVKVNDLEGWISLENYAGIPTIEPITKPTNDQNPPNRWTSTTAIALYISIPILIFLLASVYHCTCGKKTEGRAVETFGCVADSFSSELSDMKASCGSVKSTNDQRERSNAFKQSARTRGRTDSGWETFYDEETGAPYYFNASSNETIWEKPIREKWPNSPTMYSEPLNPSEATQGGETENEECVICLTERRSMVCVPCGHRCFCETCAKALRRRSVPSLTKCPICRTTITTVIQVYL